MRPANREGSEAVTARLAELLVVEAIRFHAGNAGTERTGWLGALADPRIGRALRGLHADIARPWTVAALAAEAGMSRATFSAVFHRLVGRSPLAYLRVWRLTLARAQLAAGAAVARAAADVGYTERHWQRLSPDIRHLTGGRGATPAPDCMRAARVETALMRTT